ncbi:hypothetical protein MNB_SUP05-SYMBIONT-4-254 [hydrothermal vent metagenome]|uniref:Uncharacterized protein n=1 Tax=hydrothermal vent metagenome TaxID=652676 RepID=A0A1W1DTZ9_9ZZZZ
MFGLIGFTLLLIVMLFFREALDFYVNSANLGRGSPTAVIDTILSIQVFT